MFLENPMAKKEANMSESHCGGPSPMYGEGVTGRDEPMPSLGRRLRHPESMTSKQTIHDAQT